MNYDNVLKYVYPIIESHDGFRPMPYKDETGVWYYGFGFNTCGSGDPVTPQTPPITRGAALMRLRGRLMTIMDQLDGLVRMPIPETQMAGLIAYVYEAGFNTPFLDKIVSLLNKGYPIAAKQELLRDIFVKESNRSLISENRDKRRHAEAALWDVTNLSVGDLQYGSAV